MDRFGAMSTYYRLHPIEVWPSEKQIDDWHEREHRFSCLMAENNPWQWPTAQSVKEDEEESHTCPECGSYIEDMEWHE